MIFDTGVLIGALDPLDAHHPVATRSLQGARRTGDSIVLPTLVLAELLVGAHRLGPDAVRTADEFANAITDRLLVFDVRIAHAAARLRAVHSKLRMPDAIVIASAQVELVDRIVTTDSAWVGIDSRIELLTVAP